MAKLEKPWYRANDTNERNEKAMKAYEALMTVTLRKPDSEEYKNFSDEVKQRALKEYGENIYGDEEVCEFLCQLFSEEVCGFLYQLFSYTNTPHLFLS